MTVSARAILELGPLNHEDGKRYSLCQAPKSAANAFEWSSLAG